jgi:DEAD/DEAH box helicase domain-containing protein
VTTGEYKAFGEKEVAGLIDELFGASLVVGYNILKFDYRVLQAYTDRKLNRLRTRDLFDDLYRRLNFRVSLDSVAQATLGVNKLADGCQAVQWWRAGEIAKLTEYCREDVRLTYELYRFGQEQGHVLVPDKLGGKRRVPVLW